MSEKYINARIQKEDSFNRNSVYKFSQTYNVKTLSGMYTTKSNVQKIRFGQDNIASTFD